MRYILTYGIAYVEERCGMREIVKQIPDVTCDRTEAERLVSLFNRLELSPEHFTEAVEDALEKTKF